MFAGQGVRDRLLRERPSRGRRPPELLSARDPAGESYAVQSLGLGRGVRAVQGQRLLEGAQDVREDRALRRLRVPALADQGLREGGSVTRLGSEGILAERPV